MFHLATHAFMKITLFFCAGAVYVSLHRENVSELDGVGKVMPLTMGAFAVAAAGLSGIPPINGFASKWLLGVGTMENNDMLSLLVLIASGLFNAAYFFPIVHRAFFRKGVGLEGHREASLLMVIPILITAALSLLMGVDQDLFFSFLRLADDISNQVIGGASP
jgi:multicomponent Na+:H+ antiporter subunit D